MKLISESQTPFCLYVAQTLGTFILSSSSSFIHKMDIAIAPAGQCFSKTQSLSLAPVVQWVEWIQGQALRGGPKDLHF